MSIVSSTGLATYDASTATTMFLLLAHRQLKGSFFKTDLHMAVLNKAIDISISSATYTAEELDELLVDEFDKHIKSSPSSCKSV